MYSSTGTDASNFVSTFNLAFYSIVGISLILLVGITIAMLWFVYRYNKKRNAKAAQIEGNVFLEVTWTVIPILLSLLMFYFGWEGWKPMSKPPKDAMNITTTARMWNFSFSYKNGKESPDLVVQVNTPVKLNLVSLDVLHSVFIPAYRIKTDIVPGREKFMWFLPEQEGDFDLYCAEYCGLRHSYMKAVVKVLSKEKFNAWYGDTATMAKAAEGPGAPGAEGLAILKTQGCLACHSSDGSKIVGPTYLNLFGSQRVVLKDGTETTVTADEAYIKNSIYDPNSEIVKGFPKGLMQSYTGKVSDDDISKIIEYLKSLNEK
jgi:cytochrome c oxidase subunit II